MAAAMDESRKTPEQLPVPELSRGSNISSPLKPLNRPVAGHNAEEVAQRLIPNAMRDTSVEDMWKLLGQRKEDMKGFNLPRMATLVKSLPPKRSPYQQYVEYLNLISEIVHKKIVQLTKNDSEGVIRFFDRHSHPAKDHATGTTSRPDFLALKVREGEAAPSFHWSALEAAGELLSLENKEKACAKTASYTSYLLQARPDRLIVQGIYVDSETFRLIVSNACGAFYTKHLDWESRDSRLLLCAWIWRLYRPVVDPSITANIERDKPPTFTIQFPEGPDRVCTIRCVGTAFGRRTIVFDCSKESNTVIKEQYIETSRRFEEGPILKKIHRTETETFPGVVRPGWHGTVKSGEEQLVVSWKDSEQGKIYERKKTRMVLLDKADSIMDAKTPREALIAMYDLLEVTRFLHRKRKILHRDISNNNVLLREVVPANTSSIDNAPPQDAVPANTPVDNALLPEAVPANTSSDSPPERVTFCKDLKEMCFASFLLKAKSEDPNVGRLDTRVLLIDFDMSEDEEQKQGEKGPHSRTGTPMFMARAVISAVQKEGDYILHPMPQLVQGKEAYKAAVPERLTAFPRNALETSFILSDKPLVPFKHKLKYDAESVFWLLLWWAVRAWPADDTVLGPSTIAENIWWYLTNGKDDPRTYFIDTTAVDFVHPAYKDLETLLKRMALQLRGYHEEDSDPSRKQDEYLHEAFQRLIFDFLFTHYHDRFMTVEKRPDPRQPEKGVPMEGPLSSKQISMIRSSAASGPVDSASSRGLRSASSQSARSGSSLKRKHPSGGGSGDGESDLEDGTYQDQPRRSRRRHVPVS